MIALVTSNSAERGAFAALCDQKGWPCVECESVRAFAGLLRRTRPKVALVRHALCDGYSDDVIILLANAALLPSVRIIVLMTAATSPLVEARQVALGADCIRRDPVHSQVLLAFVEKYLRTARAPSERRRPVAPVQTFAGATLRALERTLRHRQRSVLLTPREVQLVELLAQNQGGITSYDTLYHEILQRRFRGDTSNMRVLLGKLGRSLTKIGIPLRGWIEVIPKSGYRYVGPVPGPGRPGKPRRLPSVS